jgi:hypothetical protein
MVLRKSISGLKTHYKMVHEKSNSWLACWMLVAPERLIVVEEILLGIKTP